MKIKTNNQLILRKMLDSRLPKLKELDNKMTYWESKKKEYYAEIQKINEKLYPINKKRNELDAECGELRHKLW